MVLNNSTIHFDEFAEKKVLGMLLVSKEKKYFEEAKNLLSEKSFYSYANKLVYNALMDYYDKNKDVFIIEYQELVNYVLSSVSPNSEINIDFIHNLIINACLFENRFQHFQHLNRLSALREIETGLESMLYKVKTEQNTNIESFVSLIQKKMNDASEKVKTNEYKFIKDISDNYFNDLMNKRMTKENNIFGVPTGYDTLDKNTQGFKGGELIVIAARPAMGKTAFALNIATNAARNGKKVLFFSLEMSEFQLMSRIYSAITEIDASKLKRPQFISNEELRSIASAKQNVIDKISLFIDDSTSSKLEDIVFKSRKVKKTTGLDLIIVDYLQLISDETKGQNRQNEVAKISRTLKQLARELDVPVIALSQLSRSVESREDKRPLLSDLRESGAIEQDADMVVFLYRDDYYNKNKKNSSFEQNQSIGSIVEVIIAKYRSGATDNKKLRFQMNISRFSEIPYIK
ncbi:replicative DNA helicase [Mycoplasma phage sp.]|uniref:Replicative DNA helicase n=1 Tax=Mycoplasma anserisalpingitidis TaxID=519450 RepID=A0A8F2DET3_9MOLU|nr:replicative DNA helicase [Mycoplasma phage sp.]QWS78785.1 replicative DNA helicase [Mycoplasma anserisalpingitidis]